MKEQEHPSPIRIYRKGLSGKLSLKPGITRDWIGEEYVPLKYYSNTQKALDTAVEALERIRSGLTTNQKLVEVYTKNFAHAHLREIQSILESKK